MKKNIIVTGSSGFIGGHLVRKLKRQGHLVCGIDIVEPKYCWPDRFFLCDLRRQDVTENIFKQKPQGNKIDEVYNLACLMGGMGYIGSTDHSHDIMTGSTQIVANVLDGCIENKIGKLFYSSSACVYNMHKQEQANAPALKESDSYPAMPDLMYGWQKLKSELMCQAATEQHGLNVRVARFHNIFGHEGIYDGGKEKAPAAICRKVAMAADGDTISIWGDGKQARSFLFIDECLEGVERLMNSDCAEPLNVGSDEMVSIDQLTKMIILISGKRIRVEHDLTKPQGVRGRNSDNEMIYEKLGWRPTAKLYDGLKVTYNWINKQVHSGIVQGIR